MIENSKELTKLFLAYEDAGLHTCSITTQARCSQCDWERKQAEIDDLEFMP